MHVCVIFLISVVLMIYTFVNVTIEILHYIVYPLYGKKCKETIQYYSYISVYNIWQELLYKQAAMHFMHIMIVVWKENEMDIKQCMT